MKEESTVEEGELIFVKKSNKKRLKSLYNNKIDVS